MLPRFQFYRRFALCALLVLGVTPHAGARAADWLNDEPEFLPVDQAFLFDAEMTAAGDLVARWQMPDGYYLYRHQFSVEAAADSGLELGDARIPRARPRSTSILGRSRFTTIALSWRLPSAAAAGPRRWR